MIKERNLEMRCFPAAERQGAPKRPPAHNIRRVVMLLCPLFRIWRTDVSEIGAMDFRMQH